MTIPLQQLTAEPTTVTINGKELMLSPLRVKDVGSMTQWFCEKPLEDCNLHLQKYGEMYHEKKRRKLVDDAHKEYELRLSISNGHEIDEKTINKFSDEMRKAYSSLEGTARLLWLSLKKTNPELTLDETKELVTLDTMALINDTLMAISTVKKSEDELMMEEDDDEDSEKKTKTSCS